MIKRRALIRHLWTRVTLCLIGSLWLLSSAHGSIIRGDARGESAESRSITVYGHVIRSRAEPYPLRPQHTRTRYELVVWRASPAESPGATSPRCPEDGAFIEVVMPGGVRNKTTTVVPGVQHLQVGSEVIVRLEITPWGLSPTGYAAGTHIIERDAQGVVLTSKWLTERALTTWFAP